MVFWVLALAALYLLGIGPAVSFYHCTNSPALRSLILAVYTPLTTLADRFILVDDLLKLYVSLWTDS